MQEIAGLEGEDSMDEDVDEFSEESPNKRNGSS
jgi:hypothetical protein